MKLIKDSTGTKMNPCSKFFKLQTMSEIRLLDYNMPTTKFYVMRMLYKQMTIVIIQAA